MQPTLEQLDIVATVDALQPIANLVFVPVPARVSHALFLSPHAAGVLWLT